MRRQGRADVIDRTDAPEASSPRPRAARSGPRSTAIRPTYGFEDVSLAPGTDTIEPADVDLSQVFCGIELAIPILASAMDAVVDTRMAGELARLGGLAVLNLEGVQARFDDPAAILERIATAADDGGPRHPGGGVSAADPRGVDRRPDRGNPRRGLQGSGRRDTGRRATLRSVRRRAWRRPVPRPEPGLVARAISRPSTTRSP